MKIKQDLDTGKLLIELENYEKLDNFVNIAEEYLDGLADVISDNIGPEVVRLGRNQDKIINIVQQQQLVINILTKAINFLIDKDDAEYRLKAQAKLSKELADESDRLQNILKSK